MLVLGFTYPLTTTVITITSQHWLLITLFLTQLIVACKPRPVQFIKVVSTELVRHLLSLMQLVQTLLESLVLHCM